MSDQIQINSAELSAIQQELAHVVTELEEANQSLANLQSAMYYEEGMAKGVVGMVPVAGARLDELIGHYERLGQYVVFADEEMAAKDQAIQQTIDNNVANLMATQQAILDPFGKGTS